MTCRTDDEGARKAFLAFVENVEPKLRTIGFELDTRISGSPHTSALDQARYSVYLRAMRQEVKLFRAENVPLQTDASPRGRRSPRAACRTARASTASTTGS